MPKSIALTFPHDLGVAEAKKRITEQVALVKATYIDKVGTADMAWVGDTANLRIVALGQTATATIEVKPAEIHIAIQLPWLLAALAGKIEGLLKTNAGEALRLGPPKKS